MVPGRLEGLRGGGVVVIGFGGTDVVVGLAPGEGI